MNDVVIPWFRAHRAVSGLLILLAILTVSPLWYRPAKRVTAKHPAAAVSSRPAVAAVRAVFVTSGGDPGFDVAELKKAMESAPGFAALRIEFTDDPAQATAFLELESAPSGDLVFEWKLPITGEVSQFGTVKAFAPGSMKTADAAFELVKATIKKSP